MKRTRVLNLVQYGASMEVFKCIAVEFASLLDRKTTLRSFEGKGKH